MNYRAAHQADEVAIISWQPEPCIYCRLTTPAADWATRCAKIRWSVDGMMVGKETKSQLVRPAAEAGVRLLIVFLLEYTVLTDVSLYGRVQNVRT